MYDKLTVVNYMDEAPQQNSQLLFHFLHIYSK